MAIANAGNGVPGDVGVGPVRTSGVGRGTAWADCPADLAKRVMRALGATGLTMGWARVGVSLVERVPPQCFRCLARGHIGRWCPSAVDRGRCCLRCGRGGHKIGQCRVERPHCPICEERGLRAEHGPGDPSQCRVVPPGPLRSPPPDPGEGTGGEEKRRKDSPPVQGGKSRDPGTVARAPRHSTGESRGEPGVEEDVSRARSPDSWAEALAFASRASAAAGSSSAPGSKGSPSPSADMQVEWEEGPERGTKRKGPATRTCSVVVALLLDPKKGLGRGAKSKVKR